jgi:hypothetical protein
MTPAERLMQLDPRHSSPASLADQPMTDTSSTGTRDGYVSTSLSQLKRIPKELTANVRDILSRYGIGAAQVGAGMLPGAGLVEAPRNYAEGNKAIGQGDYLTGLGQYAMGAYNQVTDMIPGTPTLAAAMVPAATRGQRMADLTKLYDRPQGTHTGHSTQYANPKQPVAFEDMTRTVKDDPTNALTPWREADYEAMIGGYGIPLVGDRTEAGKILTHVNGQRLAHDVDLEGGYQYAQGAASRGPDRSGWASHADPISGLENKVNDFYKEMGPDARLYGIFSSMAEKAGDFSTMNADTMLGLVPASGMKASDMAAFDEVLRARLAKDAKKKAPAYWPGLENMEAARSRLLDPSSGNLRKAFMETADSKAAMDMGMPGAGSVRSATTAPFLRDWTGAGATGGSIMRFSPGGRKQENPSVPHQTYPHQFPAEYMGGSDVNFDRNEFFPGVTGELFAVPRNTGDPRTWANVDRVYGVGGAGVEKFDREWFDNLMAARERRLREGR